MAPLNLVLVLSLVLVLVAQVQSPLVLVALVAPSLELVLKRGDLDERKERSHK